MGRNVSGSYKKFRRRYLATKNKEGIQYCYICGGKLVFGIHPTIDLSATIDHVIPISKGGAMKDTDNIKLCCYKCNCDKGDDYD